LVGTMNRTRQILHEMYLAKLVSRSFWMPTKAITSNP
jgi:hypothetical protein